MYILSKLKIAALKLPSILAPKPIPVTYIGAGKINKISEILEMYDIKKVFIVTDRSLVSLGLLDSMLKGIRECGREYAIFDDIQPDPTFDAVHKGLRMCKTENCDGIIAFGGGSVIDTSKAISVSVTNGKPPEKYVGLFKVRKKGLPFITVPTTAGTGSETTLAAVISDPVTHKKKNLIDPKIVPDVAILDPELTVGLPPHITASTAIDALTHALEAYVSPYATEETRRYSEVSIRLIYKCVTSVYQNPKDLAGREALLVASFYGGLAFTRTFVGYVHAFAHNIGGKFGTPHGLANAILLPHIMEYYLPACKADFARLADITGLCSERETDEKKAKLFVQSLARLNDDLQIPRHFDKFSKADIPMIRKMGFRECHGNYPVPRYLSSGEADRILSLTTAD